MNENSNGSRLGGADFLRAAACAMVLLHHFADLVPFDELRTTLWWLEPFVLMGGYGVAIFFVLSGFLLAGPFWTALDEGQPMPNLKVYFLRRVARIGPGFWLVLTVTFLLAWLIFGAPLDAGHVLRYIAGGTFLAGLHWFTMFPVELNGPLWSISFEVGAYVIMALGFLALFRIAGHAKSRWATRTAWIGVILVTLGLHWTYVSLVGPGQPFDRVAGHNTQFWFVLLGQYWFPEYNPIGFFAIFSVGVLASGAHRMLPSRGSWLFDAIFLASLGTVSVLLWTNTESNFDGIFHLPYRMYPELPLLLGVMLAIGSRTIIVARLLEPGPIRFFARISFGVYLWHMLFMSLVTHYLFPNYQRFGAQTNNVSVLITGSVIVVAASVLTAAASWRWLEQPAINWARRKERLFTAPHNLGLSGSKPPAPPDASQSAIL